jgi:hypothetical protein
MDAHRCRIDIEFFFLVEHSHCIDVQLFSMDVLSLYIGVLLLIFVVHLYYFSAHVFLSVAQLRYVSAQLFFIGAHSRRLDRTDGNLVVHAQPLGSRADRAMVGGTSGYVGAASQPGTLLSRMSSSMRMRSHSPKVRTSKSSIAIPYQPRRCANAPVTPSSVTVPQYVHPCTLRT